MPIAILNVIPTLRPFVLRSALAATALVAVLVGGAGCSFMSTPTATGPKTASAPHVVGSALSVDSRNGSVEILADSGVSEVSISANFTCVGATQQDADLRLVQAAIDVARDTSGMLTIKPNFPGGLQGNDGASFVVRIPNGDADGVTVTTSNGRVIVGSFRGVLNVKTSNGPISVADHTGNATLQSSNGRITVKNLNGSIDAQTSNGPIDVALGATVAGPVNLDTSNGSIKLRVGGAFLGEISFDTSNGSVTLPSQGVDVIQTGKSSATARVGSGGEKSTVKTSNGSIDFVIEK